MATTPDLIVIGADVRPAVVNGEAGIVGYVDGGLDFVAAFEVAGSTVTAIRIVRNPEKLRAYAHHPDMV